MNPTPARRTALFVQAAGLLALLLLAGCASKSYVVLQDSPDGSVGKVLVSNQRGSTMVEQRNQGANLDAAPGKLYAVSNEQIQKDFSGAIAAQPPMPKSFLLYFESGGTKLTPESEALIKDILATMKDRPAPDISVIGHTDTVGDATANEQLGLDRAQYVAKWLETAGVHAVEVAITSHGERNLLIKTPDDTPEPRNRNVEVVVR